MPTGVLWKVWQVSKISKIELVLISLTVSGETLKPIYAVFLIWISTALVNQCLLAKVD